MLENNKSYIRPSVVINSMRDNGYKNTAYAVAELIDNSIQAKADCVRFVCFEKLKKVRERTSTEIDEIAILDNGIGMNEAVLYTALEFGGSKNREDKNGMGKFGMGLPNSSVSQCLLTQVWSWVDGGEIYYTYLDIEKIKAGEVEEIPKPIKKDLPDHLKAAFQGELPKSGSVILWSKLDRLKWKTSKTIKAHTEHLIGRIYRRQLSIDSHYVSNNHQLRVTFQNYLYDDKSKKYIENVSSSFRPNDPMYLFTDAALPEPLPGDLVSISPFQLHNKRTIPVKLESGVISNVVIRTSILKPEIRDAIRGATKRNIGATSWGQHMKKNIGLSIIRADRELDLIQNFHLKDEGRKDRWIGVEIEFEPILDECFGVTNNKQSATAIRAIPLSVLAESAIEIDDKVSDVFKESEYRQYLQDEGSPESQLILINQYIMDEIDEVYKALDGYDFKGIHKDEDSVDVKTGKTPTDVINIAATGKEKVNDREKYRDEPRIPSPEAISTILMEEGYLPGEIDQIVQEIISNELTVKFDFKALPSNDFFEVSICEGLTLIRVNTEHSFYKRFIRNATKEQTSLLFLCLAAWSKMEKEETEKRKQMIGSVRSSWGKILAEYFDEDDEWA